MSRAVLDQFPQTHPRVRAIAIQTGNQLGELSNNGGVVFWHEITHSGRLIAPGARRASELMWSNVHHIRATKGGGANEGRRPIRTMNETDGQPTKALWDMLAVNAFHYCSAPPPCDAGST
ncbi:hypothetical protein MSIM_11690 [Mycobacterium simiae]|nr:hypothetical protein MSIM_11690 [Mycobacterium simiae]